jgi:hypothetical protein
MDKTFPYMASAKNLPAILAKIKSAGAPPKFTYEFLKSNLGFASSSDRTVIGVLKALGFLSGDGTPTGRYNEFRGEATSGLHHELLFSPSSMRRYCRTSCGSTTSS